MKLGNILRKLRNQKKLSQHEVAGEVGVSQSTYNTWESDHSSPKATHFVRLAVVLGVDLNELIPPNLTMVIPSATNSAKEPTVLNAQRLYEELTTSQRQIIQFQQQRIDELEDENRQLRELLSNLNLGGGLYHRTDKNY